MSIGHLFDDIEAILAKCNEPVDELREKLKQLQGAVSATLLATKVRLTDHKKRVDEDTFATMQQLVKYLKRTSDATLEE